MMMGRCSTFKSYREVFSGVVIVNYVAVSVTVTVFIFQGGLSEYHYRNRNRSHSPIITIETFLLVDDSNAEPPVNGNGGDRQLTKCIVEKPMRRLVSARATT